jgi:hypothetical protein
LLNKLDPKGSSLLALGFGKRGLRFVNTTRIILAGLRNALRAASEALAFPSKGGAAIS